MRWKLAISFKYMKISEVVGFIRGIPMCVEVEINLKIMLDKDAPRER